MLWRKRNSNKLLVRERNSEREWRVIRAQIPSGRSTAKPSHLKGDHATRIPGQRHNPSKHVQFLRSIHTKLSRNSRSIERCARYIRIRCSLEHRIRNAQSHHVCIAYMVPSNKHAIWEATNNTHQMLKIDKQSTVRIQQKQFTQRLSN